MGAVIQRGMISRGRIIQFGVELPDTPGQLALIAQILADLRANVIELNHDQFKAQSHYTNAVLLEVTVETNGPDHIQRIMDALHVKGIPRQSRLLKQVSFLNGLANNIVRGPVHIMMSCAFIMRMCLPSWAANGISDAAGYTSKLEPITHSSSASSIRAAAFSIAPCGSFAKIGNVRLHQTVAAWTVRIQVSSKASIICAVSQLKPRSMQCEVAMVPVQVDNFLRRIARALVQTVEVLRGNNAESAHLLEQPAPDVPDPVAPATPRTPSASARGTPEPADCPQTNRCRTRSSARGAWSRRRRDRGNRGCHRGGNACAGKTAISGVVILRL